MAMKRCPDCGEKYSDTYKRCPFCEEEEALREGERVRRGGRRAASRGGRQSYSLVTPTLIVLIAVMLVLLIYLLFGDRIGKDKTKEPATPPAQSQVQTPAASSSSAASSSTSYAQKAAALPPPEERLEFPKDLICTAIENVCDEDGVALLSAVGLQLRRLKPDFDPRLYGRLSLGSLIQSRSDLFEFSGSAGTLSVRLRPQDGDSADLDDDDTYDNGQDDDDDTRSDSQSQDTDDNSQA